MEQAPQPSSDEYQPDEKYLDEYEFSPAHYIHMTKDSAREAAESNGHTVRIIKRDGIYLGTNDGIDPTRVNFTVRDGIVTAVRVG